MTAVDRKTDIERKAGLMNEWEIEIEPKKMLETCQKELGCLGFGQIETVQVVHSKPDKFRIFRTLEQSFDNIR